MQFYVDGQLVAEDVVNVNPGFTASTSLWIGCRTGSHFFADANIDEFKAFDRVLTSAEVLSLYNPENPPPVKNDICLSYYFNSNFKDSSIHGMHLSNFGSTLTTDRNNAPNSAIEVNGSQHLALGNADSLISSELTIAAWAFINALPTSQNQGSIICLGDYTYDHGLNLANNYLGTYTGFTGYSYTTPNSNASAYLKSGGNFKTKTWYHIAMTRDDSNIKLYIDGNLVDSSAQNSGAGFSVSGNKMWIGSRYGNQSYFNGKIDDILICNLVKSGQEIYDLYQSGVPTSLSPSHKSELKIYPNPTSGDLTIGVSEFTEGSQIQIYNSLGQLVKTQTVIEQSSNLTLAMPGIYFVKLVNDKNQVISSNRVVVH